MPEVPKRLWICFASSKADFVLPLASKARTSSSCEVSTLASFMPLTDGGGLLVCLCLPDICALFPRPCV